MEVPFAAVDQRPRDPLRREGRCLDLVGPQAVEGNLLARIVERQMGPLVYGYGDLERLGGDVLQANVLEGAPHGFVGPLYARIAHHTGWKGCELFQGSPDVRFADLLDVPPGSTGTRLYLDRLCRLDGRPMERIQNRPGDPVRSDQPHRDDHQDQYAAQQYVAWFGHRFSS